MATYKYTARDATGERKEGIRRAGSSSDVLTWLREQGFTPISVNEFADVIKKQQGPSGRRKKIKSSDLAALCWQLTTMVEGGIPITSALETIGEDIDNLSLRLVLKDVLEKMHRGQPFSESLAEHPKIFNNLTVAMVMAGESSGALPQTLRRLAEYFDERDKLRKKITTAMAYPIFVLCLIVGIVAFIMTFIIPRFKMMFDQLGGDLPGFTKGFMAFYDIVRFNLHFIFGGIVLLIIILILINKTAKGHEGFSRLFLNLPLFGKVISQGFVAMFCRTMSTLIGAGVSVLDVFDILAGMTKNDIIKSAITRAREKIVEGTNLSLSLASSGFFPNLVVKMMQVGEESGALSKVLDRTADYYERKVDAMIKAMISLMEPIMIVVVGGIVLIVVLALYLPIFSMK
ncbi:MAG: type II secretion system F family protein [Phycisphaerae bacterium]|jgi:type IV pilus assembly protein PilC